MLQNNKIRKDKKIDFITNLKLNINFKLFSISISLKELCIFKIITARKKFKTSDMKEKNDKYICLKVV